MSNKPGKASQKCKLLQDATKQELECCLLGSKKQNGLNDPKCSHWKPTNQYSLFTFGPVEHKHKELYGGTFFTQHTYMNYISHNYRAANPKEDR
jgi:hypothetical protein